MLVENLSPEQRSFELPLADGTVIRELIDSGATLTVVDIDPYDINTDKITRDLVTDSEINVTFQTEPDDLIGLPGAGSAAVLQSLGQNLTVDIATTAFNPTFVPVLTQAITTSGNTALHIVFSAASFHTGFAGVNVATNYRLTLDGAPLVGGFTLNHITNQINTGAVVRREFVVASGPHTVVAEWTRFGGPFNTIRINAGSLPNLFHASMAVMEINV